MIQKFVDAFMQKKEETIVKWGIEPPESYEAIFKEVIRIISDKDDYGSVDPARITVIDHGDYQGMLVFIVGATGYQPSNYWYTSVYYGSCGHCDTLQSIQDLECYKPGPDLKHRQAEEYWTLALHMVQKMKAMEVGN